MREPELGRHRSGAGGPPKTAGRGRELALLVALSLLQLVPLWAFPHFPSQDGPIHLEIADLVLRLAGGGDPVAARYFALNDVLEPTWLIYFPLAGLLTVTSPAIAEKLLLSAYVLLFVFGLRYALEGVRPGAGFLAVLGMPFVFSFLLHLGFYPFCFAMALYFVVVGYWLRRRRALTAPQAAGLALLLVGVYLCHPVPMVMALLTLGTVTLCELEMARVRGTRDELTRALRRQALPLAVAALPAAALLVAFMGRQGSGSQVHLPLGRLLEHWAALYSLVSFDYRELPFAVATHAVLLGLAALLLRERWRRRRLEPGDALAAAAVLAAALYLLVPSALAGGAYLNQRLQLFICFLLLLWLASDAVLDRWRPAIATAGAVLALGFLAVHAWQYRALSDEIDEFLSGEATIPSRSTVLSLSLAHAGVAPDGGHLSRRVEPFQHVSGLLATQRGLVDLDSYQASTGYYPVVYRPGCDPYRHLGSAIDLEELAVPRPNLDGYRDLDCSIDYLLLWGLTEERRGEPAVAELVREIEGRFERVFVSPGRSLLRVYRAVPRPLLAASRAINEGPAVPARRLEP